MSPAGTFTIPKHEPGSAGAIAHKLHEDHLDRIQKGKSKVPHPDTILDSEHRMPTNKDHQNYMDHVASSYEQYHNDLDKHGVIGTLTGYKFKKSSQHSEPLNTQFTEQEKDWLGLDRVERVRTVQMGEEKSGKAMVHMGYEPREVDAEFHGPLGIHSTGKGKHDQHIVFHRKSGIVVAKLSKKKQAKSVVDEVKHLPWDETADEPINSKHHPAIMDVIRKHNDGRVY